MCRRRSTRLRRQNTATERIGSFLFSCPLLIEKWIGGPMGGGIVGLSGALLQTVETTGRGMKKRRKDYSHGELRLDTSANCEVLGRKTAEDLASGLTALLPFFFNDTATTEISTLSLHDALPI